MTKKTEVRIKSKKVHGLYLDFVDQVFGVAIPYIGPNPPKFGKKEATKIVNWLNALENLEGYAKHDWIIEKL